MREASINLQEENEELRKKIIECEEALKFKEELHFKDQFYFKDNDSVPFCPRCWEKDHEAIHLSPQQEGYYTTIRVCPECKTEYKVG